MVYLVIGSPSPEGHYLPMKEHLFLTREQAARLNRIVSGKKDIPNGEAIWTTCQPVL